jgi:4-hydroxy-2-oxoheptanedioate aldolase
MKNFDPRAQRTTRIREFRAKLATGDVLGPFSKTCDPAMVESMGFAGFDFVILDMEHGPHTISTLEPLMRAAEAGGVLPIVRVPEDDWSSIGAVLDIGAGGVQVPQINSRAQAERVIRHSRFAPMGERGVCRFVRSAGYGSMDKTEYFSRANEALIVMQLEGSTALEQLDDILTVEGADIFFIGPYDLSQSLGLPGQVEHPEVQKTMAKIARAANERGKVVGCFVETAEQALRWREVGIKYLAYSVDVWLFQAACANVVQNINGPHKGMNKA